MIVLLQRMDKVISGFSSSSRLSIQRTNHQSGFDSLSSSPPSLSNSGHGISWSTIDFINAHKAVKNSGKYNFEGCKIPIPTAIRYDWIERALGSEVSEKDARVLSLIKYGMPVNCKENFGVKKPQKNHHSAICHKDAVKEYIDKNVRSQAMLGPFEEAPINNLCFSPLMTVPKEEDKRRIIVDFSFPPGRAVNDGISKSIYLDFDIEFSLPSVQSMVSRVNELGHGCLLHKRDLKGAFRQFSTDPGDYCFQV